MNDPDEAARTLAAMRDVQDRMAARARWSPARHLAFGALMGGLVALQAVPPAWQIGGAVIILALAGVTVARDRQRDGFFVNGYRAGGTRWIALATGLFTAAMLVAAIAAREELGWPWAALALGGIVLVVATLASMAWERAYRAGLEAPGR